MQVLDWITSTVGYSRGIPDKNWATLWLIRTIGNEYVALGVEKIAYIGTFVSVFFLMRRALGIKSPSVRYPVLILVDLFLLSLVLGYCFAVAANFGAIGW